MLLILSPVPILLIHIILLSSLTDCLRLEAVRRQINEFQLANLSKATYRLLDLLKINNEIVDNYLEQLHLALGEYHYIQKISQIIINLKKSIFNEITTLKKTVRYLNPIQLRFVVDY